MTRHTPRIALVLAVTLMAGGLAACGTTRSEKAATGAIAGALVAGPVGAAVGGAVGAASANKPD